MLRERSKRLLRANHGDRAQSVVQYFSSHSHVRFFWNFSGTAINGIVVVGRTPVALLSPSHVPAATGPAAPPPQASSSFWAVVLLGLLLHNAHRFTRTCRMSLQNRNATILEPRTFTCWSLGHDIWQWSSRLHPSKFSFNRFGARNSNRFNTGEEVDMELCWLKFKSFKLYALSIMNVDNEQHDTF